MASPFSFFRKHTGVMMVVLVGLSMASFVILDPLMQLAQNPGQIERLSVFLLPLLGAGLAWTIKAGSGQAMEYGLWGAVGGAVVAMGLRMENAGLSYAVLIGGTGTVAFAFWSVASSRDVTGATRSWKSRIADQTKIKLIRGREWNLNAPIAAVITGVLFGTTMGIVGNAVVPPLAPVTLGEETLSESDLDRLERRRSLVTQFLVSAVDAVVPGFGNSMQDSFHVGVRFGNRTSVRHDVVLGELFRREADRLQIEINDDSVRAYIERFTSGKRYKPGLLQQATLMMQEAQTMMQRGQMTSDNSNLNQVMQIFSQARELQSLAEQLADGNMLSLDIYNRVLKRVGLSEKDLFEAMREEIRIQTAVDLLAPARHFSPHEAWSQFRQRNEKQSLDVAMLPVAAFIDKEREPDPGMLSNLFDSFKDVSPNQRGEGMPGFLQPRRVKLGVFVADFDRFQELVEANDPLTNDDIQPVTDDEITAYYNKHRETEFLNLRFRQLPDPETAEPAPEKTDTKKTDTKKEGDAGNAALELLDSHQLVSFQNEPSAPKKAAPKKAAPKKADPKKADPKKADPKKADPKKTDPKKADPKKADPKKADPEKADPESPPLDLDEVDPPEPPEPRTIEPKHLALDPAMRERIRLALLNRRTERLMRRVLKSVEEGTETVEGLMKLTNKIRRPKIDSTPQQVFKKYQQLDSDLAALGKALGLHYQSTPLITREEIRRRSELTTVELAVDADFYKSLIEPQFFFDPNSRSTQDQSIVAEVFGGGESSALFSPRRLFPSVSTSYSLDGDPENVTRTFWTIRPGQKCFLFVVLEEVEAHQASWEPLRWDGTQTLAEINRDTGYQVLVPPPGTNDSISVKEWFDIQGSDDKPIRSRHLQVTFKSGRKSQFEAREWAGEKLLKDVVRDAQRMLDAKKKALARAKELQKLVEEAKPDKKLSTLLAKETISGEPLPENLPPGEEVALKFQELQFAETGEFSWRSSTASSAAPTGLSDPARRGISTIQFLPVPEGGQGAGETFMNTFFREVGPDGVGVATSNDHKAIYIGRVKGRKSADRPEFQKQTEGIARGAFRDQRGIISFEFLQQWLSEFRLKHGWDGVLFDTRRR
ncbi:MAG: hypothetical protein QF363_18650 [Planctomycetaceae bacterium]|nr:hypothetical protein [Planctomycetaceae bacterium]